MRGGPLWGRSGRGGAVGVMKSLKRQAGKCPPPPALGTATLQVFGGLWVAGLGLWTGARCRDRPAGGHGLRFGRWTLGAKTKVLALRRWGRWD